MAEGVDSAKLLRTQKPGTSEVATHRCPLCPFATTSVNDFCKHVVLHAEGRPLSNCSMCEKFTGKDNMDLQNKTQMTTTTPFRCCVCGETFVDNASLQCHLRSHTDARFFSCSFCGLVFTQKSQLDSHTQTHVGDRLLSHSSTSGWTFNQKGHSQDIAKPKERPYTCPTCGKTFCQKAHLENHVRIHTGERPFSCTICGKAFRRKEHIGRHMRIHTGERPYCCCHCGKRFSQKVHLESHVRIHTGERPFSCSACGKTFTRKEHIERHIKTHTGERMFVCSSCGKSFNQKAHLESHMRTHTGERPFNCSPCGKAFRQKVQLDRHSRTHTGEPAAGCSQVGDATQLQPNMRAAAAAAAPLCIPGCPTCGKTFCCHLEPQLNIRNLLGGETSTSTPQQCTVQVQTQVDNTVNKTNL